MEFSTESFEFKARKIIRVLDPMGLIKGGAPEDEYDSEANELVGRITKSSNNNDVEEMVGSIFSKDKFGVETEPNTLKKISQQIIDILRSE